MSFAQFDSQNALSILCIFIVRKIARTNTVSVNVAVSSTYRTHQRMMKIIFILFIHPILVWMLFLIFIYRLINNSEHI